MIEAQPLGTLHSKGEDPAPPFNGDVGYSDRQSLETSRSERRESSSPCPQRAPSLKEEAQFLASGNGDSHRKKKQSSERYSINVNWERTNTGPTELGVGRSLRPRPFTSSLPHAISLPREVGGFGPPVHWEVMRGNEGLTFAWKEMSPYLSGGKWKSDPRTRKPGSKQG